MAYFRINYGCGCGEEEEYLEARDLDEAYKIASEIIRRDKEFIPTKYFEEKYYGKELAKIFKLKFEQQRG